MKKLPLLLTVAFTSFLFGCGSSKILNSHEGDNFIIYSDTDKYNEASLKRSTSISEPFDILKVWHSNDDSDAWLYIEVAHKKGAESDFEVIYWDGPTVLSYPPRVSMFLKMNNDTPVLEETVTDTLALNLQKIMGEGSPLGAYLFNISNASSFQDVSYRTNRTSYE